MSDIVCNPGLISLESLIKYLTEGASVDELLLPSVVKSDIGRLLYLCLIVYLSKVV